MEVKFMKADYEKEVAVSVDTAKKKIEKEKLREYVDASIYPLGQLKDEIAKVIDKTLSICGVSVDLSVPPVHINSDLSLEIFKLAKIANQKPNVAAKKIADALVGSKGLIKGASVVGAFVNLDTDKTKLYQQILANILNLGERYGESNVNAGKVVVIDYSAPNIAKPIGVGHLRSTIIGQALANIYHATGFSVVKDNHVGDWGTQFGALIYAVKTWGDKGKIAKDPINELKNLYVKFHEVAENDSSIKDKARELFARLEEKDPEMVALWKNFRDLSLADFDRVYAKLGVEFDTTIGESFFTAQADELVAQCLSRDLCKKEETSEAVVVDMAGIPSFLLRKQDGTTLYLTRDLATLIFRVKEFNPDAILYVVGSEQELNFKQLFAFAEIAGYLPAKTRAKHIGFGMVLVGGKKMSTRKGTLIELEELISQSIEKSKQILSQKNSDAGSAIMDEVAEIIGLGAIIYNDLSQSRVKNISFDWEKMLNLEGGSAVYLQYTYARINSILRKLVEAYSEIDWEALSKSDIAFETKIEFDIAKKLMMFPEVVVKSQENDSPHLICVYLEELALLFNSFYGETSILKTEDQGLRNSRIALSKGVAIVIKKGLSLLNIKVPEKM